MNLRDDALAAAIRCKAKAISLPLKDLPHQRHGAVTGRQAIDRALVPGLTTRQVDGFGAKRAVFGPAKNFTINMQRDERR